MPCAESASSAGTGQRPTIDSQCERRPAIAIIEYRLRASTVFIAHAIDPPARVRKPGLVIALKRREYGVAPAQEVAQDRVGQPTCRTFFQTGRRLHGAVNHRVLRRCGVDQLIERDPKQRFKARIR
jgi:hypothetical protein